jgi:hypothetical protein
MTTRTIPGTDYTVTSTTSLDSILNPTGPQPAYPSFQLWLNDVDHLCAARLGHGALFYRSIERLEEAYATGMPPKEMYWYIDAQAAQAESN